MDYRKVLASLFPCLASRDRKVRTHEEVTEDSLPSTAVNHLPDLPTCPFQPCSNFQLPTSLYLSVPSLCDPYPIRHANSKLVVTGMMKLNKGKNVSCSFNAQFHPTAEYRYRESRATKSKPKRSRYNSHSHSLALR